MPHPPTTSLNTLLTLQTFFVSMRSFGIVMLRLLGVVCSSRFSTSSEAGEKGKTLALRHHLVKARRREAILSMTLKEARWEKFFRVEADTISVKRRFSKGQGLASSNHREGEHNGIDEN